MSMIRQVWLLLVAVVVVAVSGAAVVNMRSARDSLFDQLKLKNADTAQTLALSLSQAGGDATQMQLLVQAQADVGHYRSIRLLGPDGQPRVESRFDAPPGQAPAWFVALWSLEAPPGVAQVSSGWQALGQLEVQSHAVFAHDALWRGARQSLLWLLGVALAAAGLGAWGVNRWRRPLQATVDQAQALAERRFVLLPEPRVPELRQLSAAMNSMVQRVRGLFESQAAELEQWRLRAHGDRLTGLAHRDHFLERLGTALLHEPEAGHGSGQLMLWRVADLERLNKAHGHASVDQALVNLAAALRGVAEHHGHAVAGRLNGTDFVLHLPAPGLPAAELDEVHQRLRQALQQAGLPASTALGVVSTAGHGGVASLMAAADAALAAAEIGMAEAAARPAVAAGEGAWREHLRRALARNALALAEFPLQDASGGLLHLECPLRVQLDDGASLVAAHWLPWATRTGLVAEFDLGALRLALAAVRQDGRARGVHLAPMSLAEPGFLPRLVAALQARPESASRLCLDLGAAAVERQFDATQALVQAVRPLGVRVGLEHAGERLLRLPRLLELGLSYVKLDASAYAGIVEQAEVRAFVGRCVQLMATVGIDVHAEGVNQAAQAQALWACGVQGVSGPWRGEGAAPAAPQAEA